MNLRTIVVSSVVLGLLAAGDASAQKLSLHIDQGLVTLEGVTFFLATAALFVFLSIKVVESRRWR